MTQQDPPEKGGRFGTFGGVFTPSLLTILGVVMYLRLGKVTGDAGLGVALVVVVLAHLISLATGLSVSSIATNRTVGAGGAYYMISRALGAPAGAAIGIPLFFAQALSVTFYIVGFTESALSLLPDGLRQLVPPWALSTLVNVGLTALSFKSAELAIRAQYVVMAAIVVSLVSFFAGTTEDYPRAIEWVNTEGPGFAQTFAIFFPAVTGIMAGVSMSGDLKDPRRAIPAGTLLAIFVGFIVYLAFPIWFSLNYGNAYLSDNLNAAFDLAYVPALIYVGVFGATLSSALGSILTAPRTLQALAIDSLAPRFFGRGYGDANEPRAGMALTFVLAQTGILLGDLDAIAPVLTMFFLATYGVTNLACGLLRWAASPSFRPTFRVPAVVSLAGAAASFYVMSIIDVGAMVISALLCGSIYIWAARRALGTTYGDARHGMWSALVRTALLNLRRTEFHPLNWRPNLIIFGGQPENRPHLLGLGTSIVQDRGMVTLFQLLIGDVAAQVDARREARDKFDAQLQTQYPNAFFRADVASDVYHGIVQTAQSYGVGNFEANTVMLGWTKTPDHLHRFVPCLRDLVLLDKALLLVNHKAEEAPEPKKNGSKKKKNQEPRELHVWWDGNPGTGALMLLIAFLLTAHHRYRDLSLTLLSLAESDADRDESQRQLDQLLAQARIQGKTRVVLRQRRTRAEVMHVESQHAKLAIIGFQLPVPSREPGGEGGFSPPLHAWYEDVQAQLDELPTTILVHAAEFEGNDALLDG